MFMLTGDEKKLEGIPPEVAARGIAMHQALQKHQDDDQSRTDHADCR